MKHKQDVAGSQSGTSHSAAALAEGPESLPFTWERLIPDQIPDDVASRRILEIHFGHYETAARYVRGKRVLDIACGTGYGSRMLRLAGAIAVVGVDVCPQTVRYAMQHYQTPDVDFICADAEQFDWPERFDVIVSCETIEHLHHPGKFLERIRSLLVPEGDFLLSVPLGETRHIDPYHLHAFSQSEVFDLLEQAGFSVERYRCDDWFLTRSDLLRWWHLYPEARPSVRELLFTRKGLHLASDFVLRGGVPVPELLVAARAIDSPVVEARRTPQSLEW